MSDNIKLVIEIPEEDYKNVSKIVDMGLGTNVDEAIKNGTPLDDVKAEIDKAQEPYVTSTDYDEGVRFGLMLAYQIVDKAEKGGE